MIRNFLFHRVNPERDPLWDPMDVALFDRCISYISRHYEVRLLEDLVRSPELHSGRNFATICFDDGYKDNIQYAAPILAKYNCRASFYVVTDCIDRNVPTWTHILEYRFQHTQVADISLDFDFLPAELRTSSVPDTQSRVAYVRRLKPFLKKLPHHQRQQVLDAVDQAYTDVEVPHIMMDWDDVRALRDAGHYIGSHTLSHCMLGTMPSAQQAAELTESAAIIEQQMGYRPLTISYPVGSYNTDTMRLSHEAGYQMGLAVRQDLYDPERDSIYEIPRIELYNEPWWKTWLRITHLLERLKGIIRPKR